MSVKLIDSRGAMKILPVTISWRSVPLEISVPLTEIADRAGAVRTGRSRLRPRTIRIEGPIYYPDPAMIRSEVGSILELLSYPPIQVYQHHEDERYLLAWPTGAPQEWIDARREAQLSVTLVAPDPFFYGPQEEHEEEEVQSGHTWLVNVDGTASTHPEVTIRVIGTGGPLILSNNTAGVQIYIEGTYQSGDAVAVDTSRYTATLRRGGLETPIVSRLGDAFLVKGFALHPGENGLQYTGPEADVAMSWRPRWY